MAATNHYTFGDNERAARRLRLLAEAFEPPSRALIERFRPAHLELELALDLGSGPGHTTRLLHEMSGAQRTLGLEASERYVDEARRSAPPGVEFLQQDVTADASAVPAAGLVFCRFLLTHLAEPAAALRAFHRLLVPGGRLLVQEIAEMTSTHPALARYYELVTQLQAHYGQRMHIGKDLQGLVVGAPYRVLHSEVRRLTPSAATFAELHLHNLQTWRNDAFAERTFDRADLEELARALQAIVTGEEAAPPISLGLGELVLTR